MDAGVRGTILLSPEGINVMICGPDDAVAAALAVVRSFHAFADLRVKESRSSAMTFSRMLVKVKEEIIPAGDPTIRPSQMTGKRLPASELKRWLDEGRDFLLIDTRNEYEVELGTFADAIDLKLRNFRSISDRLAGLDPSSRTKPVVTFCTGGVRCEKATPILMRLGYEDVYQLEGGIITYFAECGDAHFEGECFVFDKRVAIDGNLEETDTTQCYRCQAILRKADQLSPDYEAGISCPYCTPSH